MPKPTTIEAYLASLPEPQRVALQRLRGLVIEAAPNAEEYFGYGMIGFRWGGHPLLYLGAAKSHCGVYGALSAKELEKDSSLAKKLSAFNVSKGTIQFTTDHPIPATLFKQIVRARLAESREKWG